MNKNIFSRLWDTGTREVEVTFTGHKTAVSCLAWDRAGLRLVSGSRDTAVIVWDVVAECGIARLQGHKVRIITYILTSTLTYTETCSNSFKYIYTNGTGGRTVTLHR